MSELQSGPCAACGLRNYGLSYGGPTICPACDCGNSGPSRMNAQRERIAELEREIAALREALGQIAEYDDPMDRGDACAIIAKRALKGHSQDTAPPKVPGRPCEHGIPLAEHCWICDGSREGHMEGSGNG